MSIGIINNNINASAKRVGILIISVTLELNVHRQYSVKNNCAIYNLKNLSHNLEIRRRRPRFVYLYLYIMKMLIICPNRYRNCHDRCLHAKNYFSFEIGFLWDVQCFAKWFCVWFFSTSTFTRVSYLTFSIIFLKGFFHLCMKLLSMHTFRGNFRKTTDILFAIIP